MYHATVPVFRHFLSRISDMVALAGPDALDIPDFDQISARQHFSDAAGLAMQTAAALAGRDTPDLPAALGPKLAVARAVLGAMQPAEFAGAAERRLRYRLGAQLLEVVGQDYLRLYALPRFFFYLTLGYAVLRQAGVALAAADLDLHLELCPRPDTP